jgi:hypothetical protein
LIQKMSQDVEQISRDWGYAGRFSRSLVLSFVIAVYPNHEKLTVSNVLDCHLKRLNAFA